MSRSEEIYQKVSDKLREMIPPNDRRRPITMDTEIYGDLKLFGDDLFDLMVWIRKEFKVDLTLHLESFAQGEPFFGVTLHKLWSAVIGREKKYKSFTVRYLITAIENNRWP